MRHPLAASPRHWPEEARVFYEERAGLIADGCRVSREESERRAEAVTRAWWAAGPFLAHSLSQPDAGSDTGGTLPGRTTR